MSSTGHQVNWFYVFYLIYQSFLSFLDDSSELLMQIKMFCVLIKKIQYKQDLKNVRFNQCIHKIVYIRIEIRR